MSDKIIIKEFDMLLSELDEESRLWTVMITVHNGLTDYPEYVAATEQFEKCRDKTERKIKEKTVMTSKGCKRAFGRNFQKRVKKAIAKGCSNCYFLPAAEGYHITELEYQRALNIAIQNNDFKTAGHISIALGKLQDAVEYFEKSHNYLEAEISSRELGNFRQAMTYAAKYANFINAELYAAIISDKKKEMLYEKLKNIFIRPLATELSP